jgi:hypothetical protein
MTAMWMKNKSTVQRQKLIKKNTAHDNSSSPSSKKNFSFPFQSPLLCLYKSTLNLSIDYSPIPLFQFKIEDCLLEIENCLIEIEYRSYPILGFRFEVKKLQGNRR